jgi:hypothetical protein
MGGLQAILDFRFGIFDGKVLMVKVFPQFETV